MPTFDDLVKNISGLSDKEKDELAIRLKVLESNIKSPQMGGLGEGPGLDIARAKVGLGGDTILHYDSGGNPVAEKPATAAGFDSLLAFAASGDVIWLPARTIGGDHSITAGVKIVGMSRYATILSGQITGGASSSIENLSITRAADSADTIKGAVNPSSGTFYINGCNIVITQAGSGDARAISAETNSTTVEVWNSYLYGNSGSGSGHGTWRDTGTSALIVVFGGRIRGSTASCNE